MGVRKVSHILLDIMLIPVLSSKYSVSRKRAEKERRVPAGGGGGGAGGGGAGGGGSGGRTSGGGTRSGSSGGGSGGGGSRTGSIGGSSSGSGSGSSRGSSGSGSSSGGFGSSGSGSGSPSLSPGAGRSSSVSTGGSSGRTMTPYSSGGGSAIPIPSGSMFSGRYQGGATRFQVYGTRQYGSGYPGYSGRGVSGRGFPYYFWPLTWGSASGYNAASYYHDADTEYGLPSNTSRPGGALRYATFTSNSQNTTFHVVADNTSLTELLTDIYSHCGSSINNASSTASPILLQLFNDSDSSLSTDSDAPSAQSVIQYYRASSVALTLDGYNNTAAWANATDGTSDTPIPMNIDVTLKDCLNQTIGEAVPLVDPAYLASSMNAGVATWDAVDIRVIPLILVFLHLLGIVL
ncbi:hypothetical protein D9758_007678 [Tetrapyrgos nigripes]|uniref:Uncharacterized protein n=1 Tax=Tetrapyrgos nigripes TaxID=182062 RepID=A0A8H5G5A7_9AGAR|nr:hypothetical protein D9758_007678 [Tetrapyrgos nigripes]